MSKILEAAVVTETAVIDTLKDQCMALTDTSKKIRFLLAAGKTRSEVYKLLKGYGVTTKEGNEIRYQFINNVMNQKVK